MTRFVQLHFLTVYPPSNPNRDDQGQPKQAEFGGVPRLRISSQAIKRAARTSDVFQSDLTGHLGERTQRFGEVVFNELLNEHGASEERAGEIARQVADIFGALKSAKDKTPRYIEQLAFISPDERTAALDLAKRILDGEKVGETDKKELEKQVLRTADGAVDVALFGRMLADDPDFNRDAAAQVAHAMTTHRALVEDDFYTAVDDLKTRAEDAGAGFMGALGFGSGVYYLYANIDTRLLLENLAGEADLAARGAGALLEALAISTPSGKRNSFAHHTRASYIRAESGQMQPRSLAGAFFKPVSDDDLLAASIRATEDLAERFDRTYGPQVEASATMDVTRPEGTLQDIRSFVEQEVTRAARELSDG